MSWADLGLLAGTLAVVALGLWGWQRVLPHAKRTPHNDVAGFVFASVGVLYSVLVGFVVVTVWGNADQARQATFKEADALAGVYWIARELPAPLGPRLERETLAYAHTVIDDEWQLMARHHSSPAATAQVYAIRADILAYQPTDARGQVLFDHALTHVEDLASERRMRLNLVDDEVPTLLWVALLTGGALTIGFTFLFGLANTVAHAVMALVLAALVILSLLVVKELDYPFGGVASVRPTAFDVFLQRLPAPT